MEEDAIVRAAFHLGVRRRLRALVDDTLIAAHRAAPNGPHEEGLARLLRYFRAAPIEGKLGILADRHFARYRIIAFSGQRGVPPRLVDDRSFETAEEADHAVFLMRLEALQHTV